MAISLELELKVGHQRLGGAVAQALLHLAEGNGMHVLVVAGHAADVEDHGHRVDLLAKRFPGVFELSRQGGAVAIQPGLRERRAIRQRHAIEGQAEQLGEDRLTRSKETRDPGGGQLRAPWLFQLAADPPQQAHVLLMDAIGHALAIGVPLRPAAGDDVFADLGLNLGRGLLMEIDHRRDIAGDIRFEQGAEWFGCHGARQG